MASVFFKNLKTYILSKEKNTRFAVLPVLFFFLAFRLFYLRSFPVFNDEAIYLRYASIIKQTGIWFYSMVHSGKQPLMYWIYSLFSLCIRDTVLAGRIATVSISFFTLYGVYALGSLVRDSRAGYIGACFYALCPLSVFFDRIALVDASLSALYIWVCIYSLLWYRKGNISYLMVSGLLIGIAFWIKSTALVFLCTGLFFIAYISWRKKHSVSTAVLSISLYMAVFLFLISFLLMQPEFARVLYLLTHHEYTSKLTSVSGLITQVLYHGVDILLMYAGYVSGILLVCCVLYLPKIMKQKTMRIIVYFLLSPLIIMSVVSRGIQGRYIVYTVPIFLVMAATLFIKKRLLVSIVIVFMGLSSLLMILSPVRYFYLFPQVRIFKAEAWQYISNWSSGYGVKDAVEYIKKKHPSEHVFAGVRLDSGNPEDQVLLLFQDVENVHTRYIDNKLPGVLQIIEEQSVSMPVYLITRSYQKGNFEAKEKQLVAQFDKPYSNEKVEIYRIIFK